MDLLPFYSRLVATLSPCVDDVAPTLLEILLGDLRHQIRKKDQVHIHTKLKNIRLLAELTKFGICPKPEAMKCITLLMRDFTHHHIDMACLFLEHCGRFLLRSPDSHLRAKALLEILLRKKKVQHLDGRQRSLVENALYYANPPEASQISVVEEHPMHQYIKKLLYKELNKMNTEKILKQVRKLDWRDLDIFHFTVSCLSHIWKVKYNNIHCVANLLAGLKSYQEEAVIRVVDAVLEDTRVGLELNLSKFNQRRVSNIKFIGELYAYQLLESNVIFKTLYLLLQFGSSPDGAPSPLDPYDSYFRVRLICILLDTCGQYFDRGSSKKRLDTFLVYFQCYIFSKKQPQPLEVENLVSDTLESLRPQLELFKTPQAAYEAALELERLFRDKIGNSEDATAEESDEEEEEQRDSGRGQMEEEDEDEEGEDEDDEEVHTMETPDTFEQDPVLKAAPTLIKCPEDDSFVATFEKMMNEDIQTRKIENLKVPNMDIVVPMYLRGPTKDSSSLIEREGEMKMMKFKVMTRKGNKQQLKELNIPLDSDLTLGLRDTRQAKTEDHEVMKRRVLEHEQRQEEEEYKAAVAEEIESQMKSASKNSSSSQPYKKQPSSTAHHQPHHYRPHDVEGSQQQSQGYQGQGPGRGGYHHGNRGRGNRGRGWRGGGSGRGGGRGGGGNYRQN